MLAELGLRAGWQKSQILACYARHIRALYADLVVAASLRRKPDLQIFGLVEMPSMSTEGARTGRPVAPVVFGVAARRFGWYLYLLH